MLFPLGFISQNKQKVWFYILIESSEGKSLRSQKIALSDHIFRVLARQCLVYATILKYYALICFKKMYSKMRPAYNFATILEIVENTILPLCSSAAVFLLAHNKHTNCCNS